MITMFCSENNVKVFSKQCTCYCTYIYTCTAYQLSDKCSYQLAIKISSNNYTYLATLLRRKVDFDTESAVGKLVQCA